MKVRGPAPLYLGTLKTLGANPIFYAWTDIYMALLTNAIDGMEASPQMIYPSKFQEVAKYFTVSRHIDPGYYLLISEKTWAKLPPDIQKAVKDSAGEAYSYIQDHSDKIWNEYADKMKQAGVEFIELQDKPKWVKAVEEFRVDYAKKLGPEAPPLYEKVKKSVVKWEAFYGIKR
jgi:TRAP-type C4-dicarboxylate transport system substrate-binding protein